MFERICEAILVVGQTGILLWVAALAIRVLIARRQSVPPDDPGSDAAMPPLPETDWNERRKHALQAGWIEVRPGLYRSPARPHLPDRR